jgi:CDP-glucose 4,6-dehydratase
MDPSFWQGRKVFLTGQTGFKGSWLSVWLHQLGAKVSGYALNPPTNPNMFESCRISQLVHSTIGDVRDAAMLANAVAAAEPEIIFHLAAQPLVRKSYQEPVETFSVNVMGTVNLLESARTIGSVRAVINVTTDKCYENKEWLWGYREIDPLGGRDPYSSSKACSELVTASYRASFFHGDGNCRKGSIATARAGNVIGGGDWSADRLIPDCIRAFARGDRILVRNPGAQRPWQHVLEPLSGYLTLAEAMFRDGQAYAESWNFGPDDRDMRPVEWIVESLCSKWGEGAGYSIAQEQGPHEAGILKLDSTKARSHLGWRSRWGIETALSKVIDWHKAFIRQDDLASICREQISEYEHS